MGTIAHACTSADGIFKGVSLPNVAVNITDNDPLPAAQTKINDGTTQRSMVTRITVTFSQPVTIPADMAATMQLQRNGPGEPTGPVNLAFNPTGNAVIFTFDDATFARGAASSLIDDNDTLTLVAPNIQDAAGLFDADGFPATITN